MGEGESSSVGLAAAALQRGGAGVRGRTPYLQRNSVKTSSPILAGFTDVEVPPLTTDCTSRLIKERPVMRNEGSIVLVEDDPDDRLLIQLAFEKARIPNPLIVLSDGESALQYLRGEGLYERNEDFHPPQLILLDLSMPRVDGFEVLAWLRKQPELKDVPVVILSGS